MTRRGDHADSCIEALLRNAPMYVDTTVLGVVSGRRGSASHGPGRRRGRMARHPHRRGLPHFLHEPPPVPLADGQRRKHPRLAACAGRPRERIRSSPISPEAWAKPCRPTRLARAQNTQRVLYEIAYLASSVRERAAFLLGVHRQLATLIDAENFYLALYDPPNSGITYPYYVDVIDTSRARPRRLTTHSILRACRSPARC